MPSLYETYQQRKTGTGVSSPSTVVSGSLYDSYQQRKKSLENFVPPPPKPVVQEPAKTVTPAAKASSKFIEEGKRFLARTAVGFGDLLSESLDFTVGFVVDNPIFSAGEKAAVKTKEVIYGKESKQAKEQKEVLNKWKNIYKEKAAEPKRAVDKIQQTDYIKPSEEWSKAPLKEKLTKRLGETLAVLGPNIAPSFVLYALNPALGLIVTVTSTANDVKTGAIENGVPKEKAELLGLGTGILVGALDRIVPDELFSPAQKSKFISGFAKRIIPISLKEAGTEIAQENLQIAAEATFREDLGWDEVKTRNALSGLGGLLGGAGATTVVGTINNSFRQDILLEQETKTEEVQPKVIEPIQTEEVVKVSEEPVVGKKLAVVEEPKAKVEEKKPTQASKGVEIKPKTVEVPKSQKVSGVAKQIEAKAVEKGMIDKGYDELAVYDSSTIKVQAKEATKYSVDEINKIATGETALPKGLKPGTPLSIAEDYAIENNDSQLLRKLANSPLATQISESASELSLSRMRNTDSPVEIMRNIIKVREEVAKKRFKGKTVKQAQDQVVKNIKEKVKVPDRYDWNNFINSIETC